LVANDALLIWNTTVLLVMCHFPDTSLVVMAWYTLATILLKVLQDAQTALIARLLAFFNVYSAAISLALAIMVSHYFLQNSICIFFIKCHLYIFYKIPFVYYLQKK
jgi:hypothetical protein